MTGHTPNVGAASGRHAISGRLPQNASSAVAPRRHRSAGSGQAHAASTRCATSRLPRGPRCILQNVNAGKMPETGNRIILNVVQPLPRSFLPSQVFLRIHHFSARTVSSCRTASGRQHIHGRSSPLPGGHPVCAYRCVTDLLERRRRAPRADQGRAGCRLPVAVCRCPRPWRRSRSDSPRSSRNADRRPAS